MLWKFCSVKLGLHAKIFQPSPRPSRLSDRVTLRTLDFSSGKLWNRLSQGLANPPDSPWLDNCGHPWMAILNQNLTGQDATEQIQLNYCFENVINKEPTKWIWITIWYTICDMSSWTSVGSSMIFFRVQCDAIVWPHEFSSQVRTLYPVCSGTREPGKS
jgi:hypothetical protein